MTPQEKAQEVAKLYQAFAEGKTLQLDELQNGKWINWAPYGDVDVPTIYTTFVKRWRVKPEAKTIWYRVALMKNNDNKIFYLSMVNCDASEFNAKGSRAFIKWETDRVYVEVESE